MLDRKDIDLIRKRTPDKRGEEGRIYFFGTPENPLALKEWYRTHSQAKFEGEKAKRIPISPFHHKAVFYEMKIIHELFPEHTVGIVGGVDQRLITGPDGEIQFDPKAGLPMTVTQRAQGDEALLKRYDAIVDAGYAIIHRLKDAGLTDETTLEMHQAGWAVDQAIMAEFGSELRDGGTDVTGALAAAKAVNPDSIIVKMLERGIAPTHPTFNFVPRKAHPTDRAPYGTFIELHIIDSQRLRDSLPKMLERTLTRWELFNTLDLSYIGFCHICPPSLVDDPAVQQALVKTLLVAQHQPNHITDLPFKINGLNIKAAKNQAEVLAALSKLQASFTVDAVERNP